MVWFLVLNLLIAVSTQSETLSSKLDETIVEKRQMIERAIDTEIHKIIRLCTASVFRMNRNTEGVANVHNAVFMIGYESGIPLSKK